MKCLLSTIGLATILAAPGAFAQGSLTPPGAPAPTMKTLDQIEPRTAITNTVSAVTIAQPGSYYLTGNLTVSSGDAITIATNGVKLDLNGFTIASTAPSATGMGIAINGGLRNLTIANGFIQGGVTNNGSGVYGGSGFQQGINSPGVSPVNALVSRVSVSGCLFTGIGLGTGDSTVVESCTVRTMGGVGILASTVKSSVAVDCGNIAIAGDQVSDCRGKTTGIFPGVNATTANNCVGSSVSGNGLNATTANNCVGSSTGGIGLNASTASNCVGSSSSGTGLFATDVATGCRGSSSTGTGLFAFIANGCRGISTSGTPLSFAHNVNSF